MTELETLKEQLREAHETIAKYEAIDTIPPPPQTVEMDASPPSQREKELTLALANLGASTQEWTGRIDRQLRQMELKLEELPMVIRNAVSSVMVDVVVELTTRVAALEKRTDKVELWQRTRAIACEGCEKLTEAGL